MTVRTRFAPSPTGFLHLGGARTALFAWAYARRFEGVFILRIEDTDLDRSTPEAVQAILDGMQWLGLQHDEGPFYQMQRIDRYREVIAQMLEAGKTLPDVPADRKPVVRFKNPLDGEVSWDDVVKGTITIGNKELDDLVIARPDGTPTYNFCVAVDDWDMQITHVLRGDDHVNNTPRQINILRAIGAPLPLYGHLPMILGADGAKLSKRHGAVSVMDYPAQGYLPEAMLNYLARLGWSHGDDEVFSMEQFCKWFDLSNLTASPAQFNPEKLNWLNNLYIKQADNERLASLARPRMLAEGAEFNGSPPLAPVLALMKERVNTINELADASMLFYRAPQPDPALLAQHLTDAIKPALAQFAERCETVEWHRPALGAMIKEVLAENGIKMPQIAMPLRLIITGQLQTPAIDAVLELFDRDVILARVRKYL
jgi:glutamyl-tRNA synthetase